METLIQEIYKTIDEKRIREALKKERYSDALTLFKYSSLTKDQFIKLEDEVYDDLLNGEIKEDNQLDKVEMKEMVSHKDEKWNSVLASIKKNVSEPSYDTWFKGVEAEIRDKTVVVVAENQFLLDWLKTRYKALIEKTVMNIYGNDYSIEFKEPILDK